MKVWRGTSNIQVAVTDVIASSSFYDGYRIWEPTDPDKAWFVRIRAGVRAGESHYASPTRFTIFHDSRVYTGTAIEREIYITEGP